MSNISLLCEKIFNAQDLAINYFPLYTCYNKQMVMDEAQLFNPIDLANTYNKEDKIIFTRWNCMNLPNKFKSFNKTKECKHKSSKDIFTYPMYDLSKEYHWHLNFANKLLFIAYSGNLYAQDEMQVLEHPILGSIQGYLSKLDNKKRAVITNSIRKSMPPKEIEEKLKNEFPDKELLMNTMIDGIPTPILIEGVDRKLVIAVDKNPNEGRPNGLYGNQFNNADFDIIKKALTVFPNDPNQEQRPKTNLIAMEAPIGGYGYYKLNTIRKILETCYTGFKSAYLRTEEQRKLLNLESLDCVIHTGFWGTGAYGGNHIIMALLQIIAAEISGVSLLIFHTFDSFGMNEYNKALKLWRDIQKEFKWNTKNTVCLDTILKYLESKKFKWGVSDGN